MTEIRAKMAEYFQAILLAFAVNAFARLSLLERPVKCSNIVPLGLVNMEGNAWK